MNHSLTRSGAIAGFLAASVSLAVTAGCAVSTPARTARHGPLILAPTSCADFTISIYFEANSAAITRQAATLISSAANRTRGCALTGVNILGLADATGAAADNLALSHRRGDAVIAALRRRGLHAADFRLAAAGDAGAQTPDGRAKPVRRRADVMFYLHPVAAPPPR